MQTCLGSHFSSRLPIEIWRQIFVFATEVPGGCDSSYISPFDRSEINDGYNNFLSHLSEKHRMKQNICLVSRQWRAVAQDLIFEYLFLQDGLDWDKLASGLEQSAEANEEYKGRGAGWFVKRLEICTLTWNPELAAAAARVIRCCRNLRILAVGAMEDQLEMPEPIVQAVFDTCHRSLKSIDWTCDLGPIQTEYVFKRLETASRLESLFMCIQQDYTLSSFKYGETVSLPNLHTIELVSPDNDPSPILTAMALWNLPKLKQVVLCGQADVAEPEPFFIRHGPQIITLEFDYVGTEAPEVLNFCTSLKELIVHIHWSHLQVMSGNRTVERIGMRGLHNLIQTFQDQLITIRSLKAAFPLFLDREKYPSLKAVRLLDFEQDKFRRQKWRTTDAAFWAFWVTRFERRGVRLEDHEGKLITIVFSRMTILLPEENTSE